MPRKTAMPAKSRKPSTSKGKKPALTGRALAVTRGKGKKTGLKRQGY